MNIANKKTITYIAKNWKAITRTPSTAAPPETRIGLRDVKDNTATINARSNPTLPKRIPIVPNLLVLVLTISQKKCKVA